MQHHGIKFKEWSLRLKLATVGGDTTDSFLFCNVIILMTAITTQSAVFVDSVSNGGDDGAGLCDDRRN